MNNKQSISRYEYRSLDNRVTYILQQRWPASENNQWVGLRQGKQQSVPCAIFARYRKHWKCWVNALSCITLSPFNRFFFRFLPFAF